MVCTQFFFSSVVDPVRSFTSIGNTSPFSICSLESLLKLILLTLNTRVNVHWHVWVSLLSWSFTESSGGVQVTSTPSRSVTSCSLQKKKRYSGDDRGYVVVRELDLHANYSLTNWAMKPQKIELAILSGSIQSRDRRNHQWKLDMKWIIYINCGCT